MFYKLLIVVMLLPVSSNAQFTGGGNDGENQATASAQSLGEHIHFGGGNDGENTQFATSQPMGEIVFAGGGNDGSNSLPANNQSLGEIIFLGGANDGTVYTASLFQSLGESMFAGGVNDGSSAQLTAVQSLGESIFAGGINDGGVFALAAAQSLAENIFGGGTGDGSVVSLAASSPLPLSLLSLGAKWLNDDGEISWTVAHEKDIAFYLLERKTGKGLFETIDLQAPAPTAAACKHYRFLDLSIASQQASHFLYRLSEITTTGDTAELGYASLYAGKTSAAFSIYPNPTSDFLQLNLGENTGIQKLQLLDAAGRLVQEFDCTGNTSCISLAGIAKGQYQLKAIGRNPNENVIQKLQIR